MIKTLCAALALAVCIAPAGAEETAAALTDLDFLIGEWSGEAVLYAPRDPSRAPLRETVKVDCAYTLKDTYIACDTAWRREAGKTRTFRLYVNHNAIDGRFEKLFIYDNWPRHVTYPFNYDAERGVISALTSFEQPDGVRGEERITWTLSDDRREIRGAESNRLETDAPRQWLQTFEFVWRKSGS